MSRGGWLWFRRCGGLVVLALVLLLVGPDAFVDAVSSVDPSIVAAAVVIAAVTTVCAAWRWSLVARGLGVPLSLAAALPAYYRSQFLNSTLPGGVIGDAHRAVRHGRTAGDLGLGLRIVVLERAAGQLVQLAMAALVLGVAPEPLRRVALIGGVVALVLAVIVGVFSSTVGSRFALWQRTIDEIRAGLLHPRVWPAVTLVSVVVVLGHVATFVIAARAVGVTVSLSTLVPAALVILVAASIPANVAGFGPREGAAAWAFASAGIPAAQGVASAVLFGVLGLLATLPGAIVLALPNRTARPRERPLAPQEPR